MTLATEIASSNLDSAQDTYFYSLTRSNVTSTACIASDNVLRFFDNSTLNLQNKINHAHDGITCLTSDDANTHAGRVITGGRDGLVKIWDERSTDKGAVLTINNPTTQGFSAIAVFDNLISAGTENDNDGPGDVGVYIWDIRTPTSPFRAYLDSHTDSITSLSFHSRTDASSPLLASSSTDSLITIFDPEHDDEEDAVVQVLPHGAAINHARFLSSDEVCGISCDENMGIYLVEPPRPSQDEQDETEMQKTMYGDLRHVLPACKYVVGFVKSGSEEMWIGSGDSSAENEPLRLTPLVRSKDKQPTKWEFDMSRTVVFNSGHGEEVVRHVLLDERHKQIMSCGEDGMVRVWTIAEVQGSSGDKEMDTEMDTDDKTIDKTKREGRKDEYKNKQKKEKREKERYKPY